MTVPTVTVRAAFGSDAMAVSPSWTDISAYVISVSTSAGRSSNTDTFGAGTATITLDNSDRRFDPTHTSGPYYGDLLPNVRVEVTAAHSGTHHLATVWADSWTCTHSADTSVCEVTGTDGSKFLGRVDIPETGWVGAGELPGDRVDRVLDLADWPSGLRTLDEGVTFLPRTRFGEPARTHIDRVVYAERGAFFFGPTGNATFVGRLDQFTDAARVTAAATFSDDSVHTGPRWSSVAPIRIDDTELVNEVTVARAGGVAQTSTNAASVALYGRITGDEITDCLVLDDIEAEHVARWYRQLNDTPYVRVDSVQFSVIDDGSDEYEHAVERQLRERIEVEVLPPGGGTRFAQDSFIESISHSVTAGSWITEWGLSPVDRYGFTDATEWLIIDTGEIDSEKVAP